MGPAFIDGEIEGVTFKTLRIPPTHAAGWSSCSARTSWKKTVGR